MKITFQNSPEIKQDMAIGKQQAFLQNASKMQGADARKGFPDAYKVGFGEDAMAQMLAGVEGMGSASGGFLGGIADMAKVQQNYMTLMSNTMSDEDFGRMIKEGFSPKDMDPKETVTILDKIKAELAKAGTQIAGYNDDLDVETLSAALGSQSLAQAVSRSFAQADLPMSEDMAGEIREAWEMVSSLHMPTDGEYAYMLQEDLSPRIAHFYLAENSGVGEGKQGNAMFYAAGVQGYYAQAGSASSDAALDDRFLEQVDHVILQAGQDVTEESRQAAQWILEKNLPLTTDTLQNYNKLTNVSFPVSEETFAKVVTEAVAEGIHPKAADLSKEEEESVYEKANRVMLQFERGELADRRLLEEVRLHMTAEVNVKLLQSGFAIDTAPMEELVEALKAAEAQVAESYFPQAQDPVNSYQTYQTANQIVRDFPELPAKLLGVIRMAPVETASEENGQIKIPTTMSEIYDAGREMQRDYENAREKYETLMTAPRADLGDSIRKAFANVDEILTDLGCELNEENRKAVRVLGYNRMALSLENIDKVREAQRTVSAVIEKMTPASVLKMIRDEVNPLEKSFEELQDYFEGEAEEKQERIESYSRFLYRLEQEKGITQEERASYIGVYRMLHQIEKRDGAAVGMVLNTGADLAFGNLLAAVRTGNFRSMDVRLSDQEAMYLKLVQGDAAIDRQIETAFAKMEREQFQKAARVSGEAEALLQDAGMSPTVTNLLAAEGLLTDPEAPFGMLKESRARRKEAKPVRPERLEVAEKTKEKQETGLHRLWENMGQEDFTENYRSALAALEQEMREATEQAEGFVDLRSLQLATKQLGMAISLKDGGAQEYYLPIDLGEEQGKLHLTLEHTEGARGEVSVEVDAFGSRTRARFWLTEDGKVSGTLWGKGENEVRNLQRSADILDTYLREETSFRMDAGLIIVDEMKAVEGKGTVTGQGNRTNRRTIGQSDVAGTDQRVKQEDLFRLAKTWIEAVTQKEVQYED